MPTAKRQKKPPRRETIIEAASALFARNGYDGTSMRDIAAESGILAGSLYYYFASKEEMFAAVHEQAMVQPYYDSLVAKLIATAHDRPTAIKKMLWAMDQFVVEGIRTTLPLQQTLMAGQAFKEAAFHTRYVDTWLQERNSEES